MSRVDSARLLDNPSLGPIQSPNSSGDLAAAVNVFFDRLQNLLPRHVSRMPSMVFALVVASVVGLLLLVPVEAIRRANIGNPDKLREFQWVAWLVGALVAVVLVYDFAFERFHFYRSFDMNAQHMALCYWIGEYVRATRV